jgi:hypothetical protein
MDFATEIKRMDGVDVSFGKKTVDYSLGKLK